MYGKIDGKVTQDKLNQHKPSEKAETPKTTKNDPLSSLRVSYADKQVGDRFEFGRYPQGANGEVRPITWRILCRDSDSLLVLSDKGLDNKCYHEVGFWRAIFGTNTTTWYTCTLRAWLNGEFYKKAFNEQEQSLIKKTIIANNAGPSTEDNVFLLSVDEAERLFANDNDRICKPTGYAVKNGVSTDNNGAAWWWLRSRGDYDTSAAYVSDDGDIDYGYVDICNASIRPAFKLAI